jgi:Cu/Ag efflux protein CusF
MKSLNKLISLMVFAIASAASFGVIAQATTEAAKMGGMKMEGPATATAMTDGEVRKVDKEAKKITIKHGEIKNLEMPGMTMVFQVRDPAVLDTVKAGDKVQFHAEKAGGAIVITEIQTAK